MTGSSGMPVPRILPVTIEATDSNGARIPQARARKGGQAWNVTGVIANAPAVLAMMDHVWACLGQTSLSRADRELIAMQMAVLNGCHYCVPAHRYVAREEAKLDPDTVAQLERVACGETLPAGNRLATMQRLVRRLISTRGGLDEGEYAQFVATGVTPQQMIETIAEIAHCTVTNFTNRLAGTPLDPFLEKYRSL